jgi:trimethylamine--corrinoid protein Co-methyltransferase
MSRRRPRRSPAPQRPRFPARLSHPFAPQEGFPEARIHEIHDTALRVLEELGVTVLDEESRAVFRAAGARLEEDMVYIGRDMVEAALATAPRSFTQKAPNPARDIDMRLGAMAFGPGAGCPNATDRIEGRRPGRMVDFENAIKLHQHFDVIHMLAPSTEAQDIPAETRHLATLRAQLEHSDKPLFTWARGRGQVMQSFELMALALGLTDEEFRAHSWTKTVINTNSPRLIDRPMGQGILDFARHGQALVITPFCLAGAMAPITVEGALVLQHAEALSGITLAQLARPGAPVVYGNFASNVDMKSGAPAFGTPEHMRMTLGSGQLARLIGLPWRSAAGTASNLADAQGAGETHMSLFATLLAGATLIYHSSGWLEGGLTFGFEKYINDVEGLQTIAALAQPPETGTDALSWEALSEVAPGGHFFATAQTMARFETAFQQPLVHDTANFGTWEEAGRPDAETRATAIWQRIIAEHTPPEGALERVARMEDQLRSFEAASGAIIVD